MKPSTIFILCAIAFVSGFGLCQLIGSQKSADYEKRILELSLQDSLSAELITTMINDSLDRRREIDSLDSLIEFQQGQLAKQTVQDEKDIAVIRALPADKTVRRMSVNFSAASNRK